MLTDLAWARAARTAAVGALALRAGAAAGGPLLEHDRRDAVAARQARSASTRPPRATGRGATGCGSARSSAGGWRRRRCCCRGARVPCASRRRAPAAASGRSCYRSRSSPRTRVGLAQAGHRRDHLRGQPRQEGARPRAGRVAAGTCASAHGDSSDELLVAGASERELRSAGLDLRARRERARARGLAPAEEYRALVRRARVFVCAPRREDYGIAQLEALADGCLLVSTPAPGPYAALPIARELDPRLVGEDLGRRARAPRSRTRCRATRERAAAGARAVQPGARSTGWSPSSYFRACLPSSRSCAQRPRVGHLARCSATRGARWPRPSACSPACACGGRRSRSRSRTPAPAAARGVDVGEVAAVGVGVDLEHRAASRLPPRTPPRGRSRRARGARSAGRSGGRSRPPADARSRRSCARSSPARPSRRTCARSRPPSRARASSSSS